MLPQYSSLPLAQEAARLAIQQHLAAQMAADQSASRLPSPMDAEPDVPQLIKPDSAPGDVDRSRPVADPHLRHIIIGSPEDVRHAIERLHLLTYIERRYWTPLIAIREQGIHITPAQGQVLSYLVQQRPMR